MQIDSNNLLRDAGFSEEMTFESPQRLLASLEIQVSEDQICQLEVRQFDDPYLLALNFCAKHQLNEMAVDVIEKRIEEIIKKDKTSSAHKTELKKIKDTKQIPKRQVTSKAADQIGNRLYEKGLKSIQKNEQIRVKTQMEKEAENQKQLTFKPKINEVSQRIVEMRKVMGRPSQAKKNNHLKKVDDEMQYCTFKPEINKESKKIVQERHGRNQEEIVEKLYYDSVRLAAKKKKHGEIEQYTYKPTINQKSRLQVRDTFMERLQRDKKIKRDNQFKSIVEDQQCSFTPEIGRPPKVARNKQNLPIGQYLISKNYQTRSKSQISHQYSTVTQSTVTNKNSETIYQNLVKNRVQLLFELLDVNRDGRISAQDIDERLLSHNSLLLLQPLFKEMEDMNAVLDERTFTKAMMKLLQISSQHLKGEFLSQRWKKAETSKYSFKPQLNDKSARIAQERSAVNLYQQGIQARRKKQVYTAVLQAKKQQQELEKCTFKPTLNSASKLYVRKYTEKIRNDDSLERMFESSQNQDI